LFDDVVLQLGDDVKYLNFQDLENNEDYKKSCQVSIKFYESILSMNENDAGNCLRYLYSQ